jgi:hypothetical protein
MPTWIWILLVLAAYFLGFLSCAILTAGSDADDWMDGYWAARRDMEREEKTKQREGGGEYTKVDRDTEKWNGT